MRLISWNCQGAFRKKASHILAYNPDILVIQECEHPNQLEFEPSSKKPTSSYWYGDHKHKGICIYTFNYYTCELYPTFNPAFRYVLPFKVTGHGQTLTLFAIWAMNNKENRAARYIGQVWLAINYYSELLDNKTILIGDFNSNKIWDYKSRIGDHSDVVNRLTDKNIHSIYHRYFGLDHGEETHPTFFLQRNFKKPYHIDYCFASNKLLDKIKKVEIGTYESWHLYSDHTPLMVDFDL